MTFNFADLKRNSQDEIAKLNQEAAKFKSGSFSRDERYWAPELDKNGEGGAVFRFLPAPGGETVPFVRKFSYGFKVGSKWFIENSPSTLGLPCPIMEYVSSLWDSGDEELIELGKSRKRRTTYIANIYIVKHKARPADEGKVFLYEFGKKIWEKIDDKMNPEDEDRAPMSPFNLFTGANFRLKVGKVSGFRNYDKSEFDTPAPLSEDESELEKIWRACHSLQAEIAPDKFKSYDDLKKKLDSVLGAGAASYAAPRTEERQTVDSKEDDAPWTGGSSADDGGELGWLQRLANGQ